MSDRQDLEMTAELTAPDAAARHDQLTAAVRAISTRAVGQDPPRRLLTVGGVLLALGFVFIMLGWAGASRTTRLFEQIPYAISGGMLGVALVFAGGFCYFAFWLTRILETMRAESGETRAALERIETLLARSAPTTNGAAPKPREPEAPYVATASGTMYHRPDCLVVAGRDGLRPVWGSERGLTPCRICEPPEPSEPAPKRRSGRRSR